MRLHCDDTSQPVFKGMFSHVASCRQVVSEANFKMSENIINEVKLTVSKPLLYNPFSRFWKDIIWLIIVQR